jgi:hypothetical protein
MLGIRRNEFITWNKLFLGCELIKGERKYKYRRVNFETNGEIAKMARNFKRKKMVEYIGRHQFS